MIVLVGKTCSGKDTLKKILVEKYNFQPIVTVTSRPPRVGEVDGKDYFFVTKDQFLKLINMGIFAEYTSYKVANGDTWYYGSLQKDYKENSVIVLNPSGLHQIKKKGIPHKSFYIYANEDVILDRADVRGDDKKELLRRLEADKKDFENFEEETDFFIVNNDEVALQTNAELIWRYVNVENQSK